MELLSAPADIEVPRRVVRKVLRKVEKLEDLPEDSREIKALRAEVERLTAFVPRMEAKKPDWDEDDEEVLMLVLH